MAFRILPVFLVALVATLAQDQCGCGQQPTVIQMTCAGGAPHMPPPPPFHPPPHVPPPPPFHPPPSHISQPPPMQYSTSAPISNPPDTTDDSLSHLPSTDPQVCYQDNELAIVIDSSGSVGDNNYKIALEFSARLASAWRQHMGNGVAAYIYGSDAHKIFDLKEGHQLSDQAVRDAIINAPYLSESTATDKALDMAAVDLFYNGRPGIPANLVLITDGASNDPQLTEKAASFFNGYGIRAVSVGIGSYLNNQELLAVAGGNPAHVFNSNEFDALLTLLQPVSKAICDQSQPPSGK